MSKDTGWIKLHRSSFDNRLYFAEPFTRWQAWCDLLLLANHKEGFFFVRNVPVKVPRGSLGYSLEELAKRWKWSRGKTERYMQFLESQEVKQIVRQKSRITTLISIVNYESYQTDNKTNHSQYDTTDGQQIVQQTDTNKNDNNENTINNIVKHGEKFSKNGHGSEVHLSGADRLAEKLFKRQDNAE